MEPASALLGRARELESVRQQGIGFGQADLAKLPDLGARFDAVVASMVLPAIPDWRPAMRTRVTATRRTVRVLGEPSQLRATMAHVAYACEYRTNRYLEEYEIPGRHATVFHRPLATYLNELVRLGVG